MSVALNNIPNFIEPTILDYAEAIKNDYHLQTLMREVPETAYTDEVELLQFQIDKVKLVFCNFTKYAIRVDSERNFYMDDEWQCLYTADDCHAVFYRLKEDSSHFWEAVRRFEKDDDKDSFTQCVFGQTALDTWMTLPINIVRMK